MRAFRRAEHSIYIQIYALTDPEIKQLLKRKSQEGVMITLFYDESASSPRLFEELNPYGIATYPVRCAALMHRKIFVVDGQMVYLSTANLTSQSLKMHDNVILGFWHREMADFCISSSKPKGQFAIGDLQLSLYLLPDGREEALQSLLHLIREAKERICVALFTLTHPQILEALIQSKQRSVELNIALDYYSKRGASQQAVRSLQEKGIPVLGSLGQQLLHHKWALVDKRALIMGSANWTEAAFRDNQDFVILISPLKGELLRSFGKMWRVIAAESL